MSQFRRRPKDAPPRRQREPGEFDSVVIERPAARMATGMASEKPAVRPVLKLPRQQRARQDIRDSARGEACLVRLLGCPGDPAMTIWSHNRHQRAGKGAAIKALDLNGSYCCTYCDSIYDGQVSVPLGMSMNEVELAWYHAHSESLVRLAQKGLL